MINRYEKFTFFIEEVGKLLNKISSDEMEALGLRGSYAIYLFMIADSENGITSAELADKGRRDKADVSRAVNTMIKKGLIFKDGSTGTNYRAPIKLTEEGQSVIQKLRKTAKRAVIYASHDISEDDRRRFYDTLESIHRNLSAMSKNGVPIESEDQD